MQNSANMADTRYQHPRHRSPTSNPARVSMPIGVGYNAYPGGLHAIPTAQYDASIPRRGNEHRTPTAPTTTITTYNVTKDPVARSSSLRDTGYHPGHRRSSTAEPAATRPIIVTTNHAKPQASSSHTSSATRPTSPPQNAYRTADEPYYSQPASSLPSRGQNRHYGHGHSQSATLDNDEFYRLRERVGGDERLRAPDPYRHARSQPIYPSVPRNGASALTGYEDEGFEYTGPSDLARYDLEHDRTRKNRRESFDKPYYRPSVNIVSNEPPRYDSRNRGPPPTSSGLDRYNRAAAAGTYDRPSVMLPAPPAVPPPPPVDPARRPALIEPVPAVHRTPSEEPRMARPRPVSLYQDPPARMSHPDDIYRSRDDERLHRDRRDRSDMFRDDNITSRGFGIRTDLLESTERRSGDTDRRDFDDKRSRRDHEDRESRRHSDEELDRVRGRDSRKPTEDVHPRSRMEESRAGKEAKDTGRGDKVREKVATGLGVAAAAVGLGNAAKETEGEKDKRGSSRRRHDADISKESISSRAAEKYTPRDSSVLERKSSPQGEPTLVERREPKRETADPKEDSRERERQRDRDWESGRERGRDREMDRDRERDWNWEMGRERERDRRDTKVRPTSTDRRDDSPHSDGSGVASRRRRRDSSAFDPTDTQDLLSLKSQIAALESKDKPKDRASSSKERTSQAETEVSSGSEKRPGRSRAESRGREIVPPPDEKQVRVVSPPREKKAEKPIKGILKQPSAKFPEEENPIREGVAPHKDDKTKKDVPPGARWTKINRRMVNPEALTIGKERFEVRDDFVIVLRVLSKDEIQQYATATAQLRGKQHPAFSSSNMARSPANNTIEVRRREYEKETGYDRDYDYDRERDDDDRRRRRDRDRDRDIESDRDRDRERHRRYRDLLDEDESHPKAIEYGTHGDDRHHGRRRSTRDEYI